MKKQDSKTVLIIVLVVTAVFSFILASSILNPSKKKNLTVPVVQSLSSTFPDVKNDPAYNTFLNNNSLDATQPVQVGNNQNTKLFNQ